MDLPADISAKAGLMPHSKASSPNPKTNNQVISKKLFMGASVFVYIDNNSKERICEEIKKVGAKITDEINADIVISERRLSLKELTYSDFREANKRCLTVGERNIREVIKKQKNVFLNQIPWIKSEKSNAFKENAIYNFKVVLADTKNKFRPKYIEMKELPCLHFGKVPRDYIYSPFDEIIEKTTSVIENLRNAVKYGPSNNGYCYYCRTYFKDPAIHHGSLHHQKSFGLIDWNIFEQYSQLVYFNSSLYRIYNHS